MGGSVGILQGMDVGSNPGCAFVSHVPSGGYQSFSVPPLLRTNGL